MIDNDLQEEILSATVLNASVSILPASDTEMLCALVEKNHLTRCHGNLWWDALVKHSQLVPYETMDGLEIIERGLAANDHIICVITDESPPPWFGFQGDKSSVLNVLRSCRFCEYFICDQHATWAIFDTHHNQLVLSGPCPFTWGPSKWEAYPPS